MVIVQGDWVDQGDWGDEGDKGDLGDRGERANVYIKTFLLGTGTELFVCSLRELCALR